MKIIAVIINLIAIALTALGIFIAWTCDAEIMARILATVILVLTTGGLGTAFNLYVWG